MNERVEITDESIADKTTRVLGELGYVAWCSCGVGTPPKQSVDAARSSLAAHIASPSELPR